MTAVAKLRDLAASWRREADDMERAGVSPSTTLAIRANADELEATLSPAELGGVAAVAWRFLDEDGKPTSKWADMDAKPMHYRDGMLTPGAYPGTSIQYAYTTPRAAEAVTEEMVERFCAAFFGGDAWDRTRAHHNNKLIFDQVRAALTAALTPRPSGR